MFPNLGYRLIIILGVQPGTAASGAGINCWGIGKLMVTFKAINSSNMGRVVVHGVSGSFCRLF
jgi:hypothetical protein